MDRREGDDDLTDDVTVSQGQMLQNDDNQQNMNLRQNSNPNRNRNQNQRQQQALYPPFENMHLNPNHNNFNEPQRPPPCYQLNAERVISSNYLPSYQNQYMRRPPSQPSTNVKVASNSGGVTGQGRPGVVADSSNTAQHITGFPRPSLNSGHPASNHAVPSNTLSRPQTRPNLDPGDPMASHAEYSYNYSTQSVVFNPNYFSIPPERPNVNPGHPMANHALASNTLSILQARPNSNLGHLMANPALASNTPSYPLASRGFVPRVGSYMSPMQIPVTPTAQATSSVPPPSESQEEFVIISHHSAPQTRSQGVSVHQGVPATSSVPPSSDLHEEFVIVPHPSASPTRSQGVSVHQGVPDTLSVPASRAITSLGAASQIRNQGVSMHQAVPATLSVPPSSDLQEASVTVPCHSASQIRSQGVCLATPSVPSHTASTSQIRNCGAPVVPVRPGYRSPRGTSQQVRLPVHESNVNRNEQVRAQMRAHHPEADERQLDILVEGAVKAIIRRRQIDRHARMCLDTDHMSHEELVELEERMGCVNTGVGEEIVNGRMIQRTFSALSEKGSETCCFCLKEYVEGNQIGSLDCGHKFHSECIKKWLAQKNTCPICEKAWHWSHWSFGPRENNKGE